MNSALVSQFLARRTHKWISNSLPRYAQRGDAERLLFAGWIVD